MNAGHLAPDQPPAPSGRTPASSPSLAEPSHAERARTLVAGATRGALATLALDPPGHPFGSVAAYALDRRGRPLLLLSTLAEHTRNALADPRASLLVAEHTPAGADPLAGGRVTLVGRLVPVPEGPARAEARAAYLAANPQAALYVDYGDFAFFWLEVTAVRYVGGFGRMSWVDTATYTAAEPDPLQLVAAAVVEHMNTDHADALVALCRALGGQPGTATASMTAVDRYGFDLIATTAEGRRAVRIAFDEPLASAEPVRAEMVALVRRARRDLAEPPRPEAESPIGPEGRNGP
ncbi:MAG: DUF2470 domain-containing protein [Actinomycetota bacterium]|nr:DUF2470 domain-containing protein [Actinomycetota bacterium]